MSGDGGLEEKCGVRLSKCGCSTGDEVKWQSMQSATPLQMIQMAIGRHSAGRMAEAISIYQRVLAREPGNADALNLMGVAYCQIGQGDAAVQLIERAIALRPGDCRFHHNLGNALCDLGRFDEAIVASRESIRLMPNFAPAFSNLANALRGAGQLDAAVAAYRRALQFDPAQADVHRNLGMTLLHKGEMREGWAEYDWRWKMPEYEQALYRGPEPRWDGGDLRGKSILVHAEQGFGDVIQFVRYVSILQEQGARVTFLSPPEMTRLLSCMPELRLTTVNDPAAAADVWCPLMTVPHLLGNRFDSIPSRTPYLSADGELVEQWGERVRTRDGRLRVGLAWAGSPAHRGDKHRSMRLSDLAPLAAVEGVTFYSLQKDAASAQAANAVSNMRILDLTGAVTDFAETAALMTHLDLVIAVDTAPAHLAGALGKPVWTLLPANNDWRWLQNRADSPWYPSMRLFRQKRQGDWSGTIVQVAESLAEKVQKSGS